MCKRFAKRWMIPGTITPARRSNIRRSRRCARQGQQARKNINNDSKHIGTQLDSIPAGNRFQFCAPITLLAFIADNNLSPGLTSTTRSGEIEQNTRYKIYFLPISNLNC